MPVLYVSRGQDGCLSFSLLLSAIFDLTQDSGQSYSVIVHDMCFDDGALFFPP